MNYLTGLVAGLVFVILWIFDRDGEDAAERRFCEREEGRK